MPIEVRNPAAPAEIVATNDETPIKALDECVSQARQAQIEWAAKPQPERGALIAKYVHALETRTEDIALCITREMGKPLAESRDEVFGPVLSVIANGTADEVLSIANDVAFGLSSCLCFERCEVVERFVAESESGMIHVNGGNFPENHSPFVGVRDTAMGIGGSNGPSTIQFYTTEHTVYRRAAV